MKITDDKLLGHVRALLKPNMKHKWENGKVSKKEADNILDMIKARQGPNYKQPVKEIKSSDWYKFTSDFVEEMDGNKVNKETGMTNNEYLDYLKDRNSIAGSSVDQDQKDWQIPAINSTKKLREFLKGLDETDNNFDDIFKIGSDKKRG